MTIREENPGIAHPPRPLSWIAVPVTAEELAVLMQERALQPIGVTWEVIRERAGMDGRPQGIPFEYLNRETVMPHYALFGKENQPVFDNEMKESDQ